MSIVYINELREISIKFVLLLSISVVIIALLFMNLDSGNNAVTSLDSWGSNLTLVGSMESMRIDIVVSEFGKGPSESDTHKKSKNHNKQSLPKGGKISG